MPRNQRVGEETRLIMHSHLLSDNDKKYIQPLSFIWRVNHTIPYLIGGVTFLVGSFQYLPSVADYVLGGWLFTIGSVGFLYADLNEWWHNNRVGCAFDAEYRNDFEQNVGKYLDPPSSMSGKYQRAENGINFMFSAIGSLLYLIGSILFIPSLDAIVLGTEVFIPGSLVIFFSQMWKLYRAGCTIPTCDAEEFVERGFSLQKLLSDDLPAVGVDLCAGLGGFAYFVGSCLFLPSVAITDTDVIIATVWFLLGGTFFTLSGICLAYRYFCTLNYAH
jgi:hypothetical protein